MLNFIRKILLPLFAPQVATLEGRLQLETQEKNFWREQHKTERIGRLAAELELKDETIRNREREDLLSANLLASAGAKTLPQRFTPPPEDEPETKNELSDTDKNLLRERARQYLEAQNAEIITQAAIDEIYQKMLPEAAHWLSN